MYTHPQKTQSRITLCSRSNKDKNKDKTIGCLSHRCLRAGQTPLHPHPQAPPVLGGRGIEGEGVAVGPVLWFKFVFGKSRLWKYS